MTNWSRSTQNNKKRNENFQQLPITSSQCVRPSPSCRLPCADVAPKRQRSKCQSVKRMLMHRVTMLYVHSKRCGFVKVIKVCLCVCVRNHLNDHLESISIYRIRQIHYTNRSYRMSESIVLAHFLPGMLPKFTYSNQWVPLSANCVCV